MELLINGSSSKGNSYLLIASDGILAIEAGMPLGKILSENDVSLLDIKGCIISHEHGDHAKFAKNYAKMGIDIYASQGTLDALALKGHRYHAIQSANIKDAIKPKAQIGNFEVLAFDIIHDAKMPVGYLIRHKECGTVLFISDTFMCPFNFKNIGLNQLLIEANYSEEILSRNLDNGSVHTKVYYRIKNSHMSLETLQEMLRANVITNVNNIVLIHLSDQNSDSEMFKKRITEQTGKTVHIAEKGMRIPFNITPF